MVSCRDVFPEVSSAVKAWTRVRIMSPAQSVRPEGLAEEGGAEGTPPRATSKENVPTKTQTRLAGTTREFIVGLEKLSIVSKCMGQVKLSFKW